MLCPSDVSLRTWQAFAPGRVGATRAPESESITRGIFLVTTFVWDVEGAVLNAARTYGLAEASVL